MDELRSYLKQLHIKSFLIEPTDSYKFVNVFTNKQKLPITQVHLERPLVQLKRNSTSSSVLLNENNGICDEDDDSGFFRVPSSCTASSSFSSTAPDGKRKQTAPQVEEYFQCSTDVLPALHPNWIAHLQGFFPTADTAHEPYFQAALSHLAHCSYHEFWCLIFFEADISTALRRVILHATEWSPPTLHLFYKIYRRLITSQESETEFMPVEVMLNCLFERNLLNLHIVLVLIYLYESFDTDFTRTLADLYFVRSVEEVARQFDVRQKEVEQLFVHTTMVLEVAITYLCGSGSQTTVTAGSTPPLAIEPKPKVFCAVWTYSFVNYLWYTVSMLHILLEHCTHSVEMCLQNELSRRLSHFYERIFGSLYELLEGRSELTHLMDVAVNIYRKLAKCRECFIQVFHCLTSGCIQQAVDNVGNANKIDQIVEVYNRLMTSALEDEYFICDYNEVCNVADQIEIFSTYTNFDRTRSDYIVTCIKNYRRCSALWTALNTTEATLRRIIEKYAQNETCIDRAFANVKIKSNVKSPSIDGAIPSTSKNATCNNVDSKKEAQIEESIRTIMEMFPHLGDGFILKCLEALNFEVSHVISAILENNLPPDLFETPFDLFRIPPEPTPPPPIEIQGKRTKRTELVEDQSTKEKIKSFILDGIQYSSQYDVYDDEYDDRLDDISVSVRDDVTGDDTFLTYNPNRQRLEIASDQSDVEEPSSSVPTTSRNKAVDPAGSSSTSTSSSANRLNFCQDPAIARAERERKYTQQSSRKGDVVGAAKGQGQNQEVLKNRDKKTVQKSSRANHNRKSGAQWKRNRGMMQP